MTLEEFEWMPSTSTALTLANISASDMRQLCSEWLTNIQDEGAIVLQRGPHSHPSNIIIWFIGLGCVTLISLCAAVGILFVRGLTKRTYNHFITVFVAVGVGSLITSSMLHLLPQGLGLVDGEHYDFITVEMFSIFGIYTFFFCDKFIKISLESKKIIDAEALDMSVGRVNTEAGTLSLRSTDALIANGKHAKGEEISTDKGRQSFDGAMLLRLQNYAASDEIADETVDMSRQAHGICVHDHEITFNEKKDSAIKTVAWMIVFGDGLHNFIDGISIGAAFSESLLSGLSVSLAVLAEEFPHELGDVAILLNAGMSLKQTLFYNLLSTITCFIGFILGVVLGSVESFLKYIFGFSGGMFLYIALSCMMPEMKRTMEDALAVSRRDAFLVLFLQTVGVCMGTLSMFFFARYGDLISIT